MLAVYKILLKYYTFKFANVKYRVTFALLIYNIMKIFKFESVFNYYYNGVAITKDQFIKAVPCNWQKQLNEYDEYSWGNYRAILRG